MNNCLFLYFKCYVFTLNVISSHTQSSCKVVRVALFNNVFIDGRGSKSRK